MQHWYIYHSVKTMRHDYATLGISAVYSKNNQPKLCLHDIIWVVEGSIEKPTQFRLVDCFQYSSNEYPPFSGDYAEFKLRILGKESLLKDTVLLDTKVEWFSKLHKNYITKRKFFCLLSSEPDVIKGFQDASSVRF